MQDLVKIIWCWLKKQSPEFLRLLCVILIVWILGNYTLTGVKQIFTDHTKQEQVIKKEREAYTVEITPIVNRHIKSILTRDENANNVILLNYHNTLLSSHGLSYRYLTAICEWFKGVDSKPCSEYWKELDYMNYGEEIHKINIENYMYFDTVANYRNSFPKFTYLLERSEFKSAAFYPIIGVNGAVGMLIVGYKGEATDVDLDYVRTILNSNIQPLSTLLDYDYVTNK